MRFFKITRRCLAGLAVCASLSCKAEIVVIVAANSPVVALSPAQVSDIFLCKSAVFPGGAAVVPLDQAEGSPIRLEFYGKTTGKTPELLKAYWSKMIFTGQGEPPREIADSERIKKLVANNPHYIGYIDKSAVDASVKTVLSVR
ncbi:MAG TPA: phosphate ABC transporter substrate-binding protein [Burkholderiaceae bacterium]